MADDKTAKMPEQSVTNIGLGKKNLPSRRKHLLPQRPKKGETAGNERWLDIANIPVEPFLGVFARSFGKT